jgi:hypothetical protein
VNSRSVCDLKRTISILLFSFWVVMVSWGSLIGSGLGVGGGGESECKY